MAALAGDQAMVVDEEQLQKNLEFLAWRLEHGKCMEYIEIWRGAGDKEWAAPPKESAPPTEKGSAEPTPDDSPDLYG